MKIFRRRIWTLRDTVIAVVFLLLGTLSTGVSLSLILSMASKCLGR